MIEEERIKKLAKDNPIEYLKEVLEYHEKEWRKDIKDEDNKMLQYIKEDKYRLGKFMADLDHFRLVYGIDIEIKFY